MTTDDLEDRVALDHPDLLVLCRYDGEAQLLVTRYVSPAAERLLGRHAASLVGIPLRGLLEDTTQVASDEARAVFFAQLREVGHFEFPGTVTALHPERGRLRLRARLYWPKRDEDLVIAILEDVTGGTEPEHQRAADRLRTARELSGLIAHHINNALASALLEVEAARTAPTDTLQASLESAASSIVLSARVLSALSATQVTVDLSESVELEPLVRAELAAHPPTCAAVQLEGLSTARFVWGGAPLVRAALSGFFAYALGSEASRIEVALVRLGDGSLRIRITARDVPADWLPPMLDPTGVYPLLGTMPVRLFASAQVLLAIGGRVEVPRLGDHAPSVELVLREAPGYVPRADAAPRVLLVSGEGLLRAAVASVLAPWPVEFTESFREGLVRAMRYDGGVVLVDVDRLDVSARQLAGLQRAVAEAGGRRFVLLTRDAAALDALPRPAVLVPLEGDALRQAARGVERE